MLKSKLIILDLDHTLIYGSYAKEESAALLFQYSAYLKIYERPNARNLIIRCTAEGDIMVYTTAKSDYAKQICEHLNINPIALHTRKDCHKKGDTYMKALPTSIYEMYSKIIIIDDSPNVWDAKSHQMCHFIVPSEFRGNIEDNGLREIIKHDLLSNN